MGWLEAGLITNLHYMEPTNKSHMTILITWKFTHTHSHTHSHTLTHTHTHTHTTQSFWWPTLTCFCLVHLQILNGLELFPLDLQLFVLLVQTLEKKHSQSKTAVQWNDASLQQAIMPQDYPWTHPRAHLSTKWVDRMAWIKCKIRNHSYSIVAVSLHEFVRSGPKYFSDISLEHFSKLFKISCHIVRNVCSSGLMCNSPTCCCLPNAFRDTLCRPKRL